MEPPSPPRGVIVPAAFFAASGLLDLATSLAEAPRPFSFWTVWEALGRCLIYFLVAAGLWRRIAICRSLAMVYCLATVITYGLALGLALAREPLHYAPSLIVQSIFQIPSCLLLLPFLRSTEASRLFERPLLGRR